MVIKLELSCDGKLIDPLSALKAYQAILNKNNVSIIRGEKKSRLSDILIDKNYPELGFKEDIMPSPLRRISMFKPKLYIEIDEDSQNENLSSKTSVYNVSITNKDSLDRRSLLINGTEPIGVQFAILYDSAVRFDFKGLRDYWKEAGFKTRQERFYFQVHDLEQQVVAYYGKVRILIPELQLDNFIKNSPPLL